MRFWKNKKNKETDNNQNVKPISNNLENNLNYITKQVGNSSDIIIRRFSIGVDKPINAAIIYTDGLVNNSVINSFLEVLLTKFPKEYNKNDITNIVKEKALNISEVNEAKDFTKILNGILTGNTAILIDNSTVALITNTKGWENRNISEPENQLVLRGPRQGFIENLRTNTSMIRRIIKSSKLRIEELKIGTLTETTVAIIYIEGIAHEKVVNEIRNRIKRIKTDSLLGTGYIEDFISDNKITLWPTMSYTERPDTAAGNLLEGKVVVIVDGTPYVLIMPITFFMFFQTADDYYLKYYISSFMRMLRFTTFIISMTLPSLYVATITYHPELLPTELLISISAQREGIPFPAFIEALIMELTFEVLREAGLRLPRAIGQAVSIVGALVLGTAAVEAGIVSSAMVIIVSMTAISSFTAPYIDIANTARIIRFAWLTFASVLGLFGILFGLMLLTLHLASLRSFGIPYLSGIAPFNLNDQKDLFIRVPRTKMNTRPRLFGQQNPIRQDKYNTKPSKNREK